MTERTKIRWLFLAIIAAIVVLECTMRGGQAHGSTYRPAVYVVPR